MQSAVRPSPIFLSILAVTVAGGALCLVQNRVAATAGVLLVVLGGWVVSLCLHEFGHAIVAHRGGDYSVRGKGYLDLDPRRYTDPVLSIVLPILFVLIGGIPIPGGAVWLNQHALRSRAIRTWVSLAGPLANLALGVLLSVVVALTAGDVTSVEPSLVLMSALSFLAYLQILAFILNILPVPGLDGWGAIEPYLSYEARAFGAKARPWAPLILVVVLFAIRPLANVFFGLATAVFGLLGGDTGLVGLGDYFFRFWNRI
jgi:Zn-dependent protease